MNKNKNGVFITIIIPVYNVEKYIEKCLISCIRQNYKNIEILVVIDGSTDLSLKIVEELQKKDSRIKILEKENGGLSSARNYGLKYSKGDYILFLDGDDWLDENCIEKLLLRLKQDVDIIFFPYVREYLDASLIKKLFGKAYIEFNEIEIRENLLRRIIGSYGEDLKQPNNLENLSTAWGKLYKKNVINNNKFIDTKIIGTEDAFFNINVLYNAKKIIYTEDTFYHYLKENQSSLTKKYNKYLFQRWCKLYEKIDEFIKEKKLTNEYRISLNNRIVINLLSYSLNIVNSDMNFIEKNKELKNVLNNSIFKEAFSTFDYKNLSFIWKIYYKSCYYRFYLVVYFLTYIANKLKKKVG